ncbi:MAG: ABC transporter substrate-binding protein [Chloroflexi bacterium]|nr:ABC transporter substrate-binding protein [Chloroflexota bacterium]
MSHGFWRKPSLVLGILVSLGLLTAVACGAAEEPTPTPPPAGPGATSTPTPPPAVATPTPTTTTAVVATPTATAIPTPTPLPGIKPKRGGLVKQSAGEDPQSFDGHTATSSAHNIHNQKLTSLLLWNSTGNEIVPDAAESYTISADGKVWTFKLRPNVKFQTGYTPAHPRDGTAMNSKDVKWSLEKIMGLHGQTLSARSGWMKEFIDIDRADNGIEVVDDLTFKIHLIQAFPGLASILAIGHSQLIPEGIVGTDLQKRPYGTGPFRLKSFQRGALWQYARNPDYFKPGLPYLDQWDLVLMDGTAIIQAAFLTRKVDVSGGNPTADNKAIFDKRMASGEIYELPDSSECRPQAVNFNHTKPPFNDIKLRQAVNMGIDREAYKAVVHEGYAIPVLYLDTDGWGRSTAEIMKLPGHRTPHDADRAEAIRIIKELYPSGLDVKMMARNTSGYMRQAEFIAGDLRKLGINVTVEPVDTSVAFGRAEKLDYTIWSYWFCQTTRTPDELFGSYFITGGSRNWIGYSDPMVDKGYLDMAATADPLEKRKKALALEDRILAYLPSAPLAIHTSRLVVYSYVQDVPPGITQYMRQKTELVWRSDI